MTPNEINILKFVEAECEIHYSKLSKRMRLEPHYIAYLCGCLIKVGYLREQPPRRYKISEKGIAALIREFFEVKRKLDIRIERLAYLRDGTVSEIVRLGKQIQTQSV